ncbi:MAG: hypothetical protein NC393_06195 [Clostridium sp.]|nr:hypothetical protein [Clostridium sp.]MCM1207409.1 hypothetical protein [Ruminococcus sp.]
MPRKRKKDYNSCKFTFDLAVENKQILDEITSNYNMKYGPMLNKILSTFCRMPSSIRKVIEKACVAEYKKLSNQIEQTEDAFYKAPLKLDRDFYADILNLINKGRYEFLEGEITEKNAMVKVKLAEGYLIIPADWIIVNPESAESCRYAAVLECRNSAKYGIPHFIYFNNFKYANEYTDTMEKDFYTLCREKWPKFAKIEELSEENQLVADPNNKGEYLNVEAHLKAPIIGLFSIKEQDENLYNEPPYGAMIVRE